MKDSVLLCLLSFGFGGIYALSYVKPDLPGAGYQETFFIVFFILVVGAWILQKIEDLEEKVEKKEEEL